MENDNKVIHKGVITSIKDATIFVHIEVDSACSNCHSKKMCGVDNSNRIIEVISYDSNSYKVGEQVIVSTKLSKGMKAVFFGYLLPFLIMIIVLIVLLGIGAKEWLAGLSSLAILAPYYLTLYLFRNRFKKEFSFNIEKL